MNIPIGLLGVCLVSILIDNVRSDTCRSFDWSGALLAAVALGCLTIGLDRVAAGGAALPCLAIFALAVAFGAWAVHHMRRCGEPLLELALLRIPTFATAIAGGASFRMAAAAIGFLLPLLLQIGFGMGPFAAGVLVFFSALGAFLMKASSPPILRRFGFRHVLLVNGCLSAASIFACLLLGVLTPWVVMAAVLLAGGFVRSLQFAALNTVVYADVPPSLASAATSFASMVQPLASGAGVAVSAVLLRLFSVTGGTHAPDRIDIRVALGAAGLIALVGTLPFRSLAHDAGGELSGHGLSANPE